MTETWTVIQGRTSPAFFTIFCFLFIFYWDRQKRLQKQDQHKPSREISWKNLKWEMHIAAWQPIRLINVVMIKKCWNRCRIEEVTWDHNYPLMSTYEQQQHNDCFFKPSIKPKNPPNKEEISILVKKKKKINTWTCIVSTLLWAAKLALILAIFLIKTRFS